MLAALAREHEFFAATKARVVMFAALKPRTSGTSVAGRSIMVPVWGSTGFRCRNSGVVRIPVTSKGVVTHGHREGQVVQRSKGVRFYYA